MTSKTKVRGTVTVDEHGSLVCTCTEVEYWHADENGEPAYVTHAEYENTMVADRDSATETGSYWYTCSRCGAGAWSGL